MSAGRPILRPRLLCAAALALSVGCSSSGGPRSDVLAARILPSMDTAPTAMVRPQYDRVSASPGPVIQARADESGFQQNGDTEKLVHGLLGWGIWSPQIDAADTLDHLDR